ncbi:MAG: hypothetical protein H7Z12_18330 [Rhodospirillaceae bacterium]|nr:hypothetical protein [Rhodospirillales bacterium]
MHLIGKLAAVVLMAASLGACATQSFYTTEALRRDDRHPRILMMPPDVELSELTAGGGLETNALWTQAGTANLTAAVKQTLMARNTQFVEFAPPKDDTPEGQRLEQIQKLHGTVGDTIRIFHTAEANRLPTKGGKFDWTLGPATQELAAYSDADYALFVWVRDSYTSPGRAALKAAALLLRVYVPGGIQYGHASLVDLKTGQVVWFNALHPREAGDLRTAEPAKDTVAMLLDNLPK